MKKISIKKYTIFSLFIFLFFTIIPLWGRGFGRGRRAFGPRHMSRGIRNTREHSEIPNKNILHSGQFSHGGFGHHTHRRSMQEGLDNTSLINHGWIGGAESWGLFGSWGIGITSAILIGNALAANNGGFEIFNQYDLESEIYYKKPTNQNSQDIERYAQGKAMVIDAITNIKNLSKQLSDNYDQIILDNENSRDTFFIPIAIQIQFQPLYKLDILETTTDTLFETKTKLHKRIDTVIFRGDQAIDKKVKNIQKQTALGFDLMYKNGIPTNNQDEIDLLQDKIINELIILNNFIVDIAKKILK